MYGMVSTPELSRRFTTTVLAPTWDMWGGAIHAHVGAHVTNGRVRPRSSCSPEDKWRRDHDEAVLHVRAVAPTNAALFTRTRPVGAAMHDLPPIRLMPRPTGDQDASTLSIKSLSPAGVVKLVNTSDLNPDRCGFESRPRHQEASCLTK